MKNIPVLTFIPGLVLCLVIVFKNQIGPYHLGLNQDPSYMYLMNGLNLVKGKPPGHVDNPGTTLQGVAAIGIGVTYLFSGKSANIEQDVITNPEKYLDAIHAILLGLVLLVVLALAYRIAGTFGWRYAVFFQLSLLAHPKVLYELAYVKPEAFSLMATLAYMYVIFNMLLNDDFDERYKTYCRNLGIICGVGIISKFTFLPFIFATLFLLSKATYHQGTLSVYIKGIGRFLLYFLVTCLIIGFPILFSVQYLAHWVIGLVINSGKYGGGEPIIIAPSLFSVGLKNIISKNILFILTYLVALISWIYGLVKPHKISGIGFKVLTFLLIVFSLQILIVAKHYAHHYLMPVLPWSLFTWLVLQKCFNLSFRVHRAVVYGSFLAGVLLFIFNYRPLLPAMKQHKQTQGKLLEELKKKKYQNKNIVGYQRASGAGHALIFGIFWAGKTQPANSAYYRRVFRSLYAQKISDLQQLPINELIKDKERVIIQTQTKLANGFVNITEKGKEYRVFVKQIYSTGIEHLFKIVKIEKQ